ncbi:hypothetical protein J4731_20650 [Providencia rettgeri]|nr:hypothetical protein [Providencia rettgeri]
MILSVSMPLIFWTKMNDINRPLAIFFGWTPAKKTIHPSPSNSLRSSDHLFRPCIWSLKNVVVRRFADGALPQNETRSLGFTCHRWGVSFRFGSPCFSLSSLDAHQDKNKSLPPSFYSVGQIASCHKTSL